MPELSMPIAAPAESLPASLPAVLDGLWSRIAAALDGRWRAWALPVLVTVAEDGAPRARVLALRGVERDARRFVFHTDARSDRRMSAPFTVLSTANAMAMRWSFSVSMVPRGGWSAPVT